MALQDSWLENFREVLPRSVHPFHNPGSVTSNIHLYASAPSRLPSSFVNSYSNSTISLSFALRIVWSGMGSNVDAESVAVNFTISVSYFFAALRA